MSALRSTGDISRGLWENNIQRLWMKTNFQWKFATRFAINLDRHGAVTLDPNPGCGFHMYRRIKI